MKIVIALMIFLEPLVLSAQRITYSDPEQADGKRTNFDIIGKINGNILAFKNNRTDNAICIYDNDMKLLNRVTLTFMPTTYINIDFISYPDYCYMIYEYQKKNIVHCTAVKLDGQAHKMGEPVDLDTTQVGFASSNKIYTIISSDDKQYIMAFKINSKNPKNYVFTTFLYDNQLTPIDRHRINLTNDERNVLFANFLLDNEGKLVFGKFLKSGGSDYISNVSLITKGQKSDTFSIRDIGTNERVLDEIKIKVDNNNKRYLLTGFYYKQKKGNIEGLYTFVWDEATDNKFKETLTVFSDDLRNQAKSSQSSQKMAFNDYFIKNVIIKKDGGYLLVSECDFTTSRGIPFNRWDYMYGYNSGLSPLDYYSPYYNPYNPWNRYGYPYTANRYNSENILVLSFDKDGNLEWSNIIPKTQYDDETDNLISHHMMNTGGELHFLYNQYERRTLLLSDQSITPDGKLNRYPTFRNLDKGYDFLPRYGKQISSRQIVIPCFFRSYLCFAKIDF
jgi:hypothetical protein